MKLKQKMPASKISQADLTIPLPLQFSVEGSTTLSYISIAPFSWSWSLYVLNLLHGIVE